MENVIVLSFEYSKELEKKRVLDTMKRLEWYQRNGYGIELLAFPKSLDPHSVAQASKEDVSKAVDLEYNETKYIATEQELTNVYNHHKAHLAQFIQTLGVPLIPHIVVQLTVYGIAGSYSLPNRVIADIAKTHNIGLLKLIFHEIVHLHIEHLIHTHHIEQWSKERIVDLLMIKLLPDMVQPQKIPMDTADIDTAFTTYYPNVTRIIETVGGLNKAAA